MDQSQLDRAMEAQQERLLRKEAEEAAKPQPPVVTTPPPVVPEPPPSFGDNILLMELSGLKVIAGLTSLLKSPSVESRYTGEIAMAIYELHKRLSRIEAALIQELSETREGAHPGRASIPVDIPGMRRHRKL